MNKYKVNTAKMCVCVWGVRVGVTYGFFLIEIAFCFAIMEKKNIVSLIITHIISRIFQKCKCIAILKNIEFLPKSLSSLKMSDFFSFLFLFTYRFRNDVKMKFPTTLSK